MEEDDKRSSKKRQGISDQSTHIYHYFHYQWYTQVIKKTFLKGEHRIRIFINKIEFDSPYCYVLVYIIHVIEILGQNQFG